jgi:cytochrome c-type biogenesis protein CcmH/NrfG
VRFRWAIDAFYRAIRIHPEHAEAYSGLGHALFTKCDFDAAIDAYKLAIRINPAHEGLSIVRELNS